MYLTSDKVLTEVNVLLIHFLMIFLYNLFNFNDTLLEQL